MDFDEFDLFWSEPIKDLDGYCSRLLDDGADVEFDLFWSEPIKERRWS